MVLGESKVSHVGDSQCLFPRSEYWTLKKPEDLPTKLKSAFRAPDLKKMLRVFRGEEIEETEFGCEMIVVITDKKSRGYELVFGNSG